MMKAGYIKSLKKCTSQSKCSYYYCFNSQNKSVLWSKFFFLFRWFLPQNWELNDASCKSNFVKWI